MEEINEVTRARLKIVQPHPGPMEDSSQIGSDVISLSGTLGTEKFTLSDTLSHSPDKQSKQQYLFKSGSLGLQQQKSKRMNNGQRLSQKKSHSFMITQEDEISSSQQDTPNIRIKSQSNLHENQFNNEDIQEQHISSMDIGKTKKNQNYKSHHYKGPSFGVGQSELRTHSSSNMHYQNSNNNYNNGNYHYPYHPHISSVSTFSFQQLLPQQMGLQKNESQTTQSPPARFGVNEELGSDIIKLQDDDEESYSVPYPTYKVSSEENNINNNTNISQKEQSVIYNQSNNQQCANPQTRFQLSLYQATDNMGSNSDDQIQYTDINNNKSSELNDIETSKNYTTNYLNNQQLHSEISQGALNVQIEQDAKELCASNRKRRNKNHSHLHVTQGDLAEEEKEGDDNEEQLDEVQYNDNQTQLKDVNVSRKKSVTGGSSGVSGLKSKGRTPQSKITSKASPANYYSNFKNYVSKISGMNSEGPILKSEIHANSVSQRRDDFSNLHLMNMHSHLHQNDDQQQDKDANNNRRDKSRSIAMNVIQALQKARQKHLERAKADKQAKIMKRVSEFISILKMRSKLRTPSMIKKKILEIINDLVYANRQNIFRVKNRNLSFRLPRNMFKLQIPQSNWIHQIYNKIQIPLFHPQSMFKLTWDFIHISIIILIFIYIPIQMVTGQNMGILIERESQWGSVILMIFLFFIIDIMISLNTGIYDQGIVNENRKDVAITYIKRQMILDILFSVSIMKTYYDMESEYTFSIICCFILFFKIFKLRRIVNNFTDILLSIRNNTKLYYLVELMSLLGTILFVGHIFGCAFWKVAEQNNETSRTWMKKINIQDQPWQIKYLYAIYYSITTMITVGYGDITPQNSYEIVMGIVYMILSSAIFGYSLNTIGGIIKEIQKDGHYIKEQMSLVNRYLNDKNISRDLKVTIRMFLQYKLKTKNIISLEQEKYIQEELSTHLREKLISEENINIMRQCKSTFSHFSEECLQKLALRVKQIRVSKNEMIFEEGQIDDDPIFYFIQRGSIELFVESVKGDYNFTTLAILTEGNSLGEPSIYLDQIKTVSAKAMEMSILRTLSRSDILDVLRFFPKDYERFCYFRDEILYNKQTEQINQSCYNCQSIHHTINQCPSLHYVPDKEKVVLAHIYSEDQNRGVTERVAARRMNAVSNQSQIQQLQEMFISRQKEEMMLLTWDSEENQNFMTSEQDESITNQTNRISHTTANTHRQHNQLQPNNISTMSNYKYSYNNLINRSRSANKSGFHPDRIPPPNKEGGEQISRSRNEAENSSSSSGSPSTHSSHSSSILSHSFVVLGRDKRSLFQQQIQNHAITFQPSNPMLTSNAIQNSQVSSNNNLQQKGAGIFRMTETVQNPIIKEEDSIEDNRNTHKIQDMEIQQDESNKVSDQIGDERQTQHHSIQFRRTESNVQKHAQMISTISGTGSGGNENSNNTNFQGFSYNLPLQGDRGRQPSMTTTTKSIQKPPQAPTSTIQPRTQQRNLSIKLGNSNQQGQPNAINVIEQYQQNIGSTGNLLEVPKMNAQRKDSGEVRMNTSLSNRSKQTGENEYNTGRTSYQNNTQIQQSGNFPLNSGFTFHNTNSHLQNNTAHFNTFESSQLSKQQKIHFDRNQDIPFYNTNEITEESSTMSKHSGLHILRANSTRRSTKNALKRQSNINASQQQFHNQNNQQNTGNIHNSSEDTEYNKLTKLLISILQERTPLKNITPMEGVTNKQSFSPIPRKNTSITQPMSNVSQSNSRQQNFSTFYQNYINQQYPNQIPPPVGGLQNQMSQHSQQHNQDNQYVLNGIQQQHYMRRRKHLDDIQIAHINEVNPQQPNIPLIKNLNNTITRDYRTLHSGIHNSGGLIPNNGTPVNHKQFQKQFIVQRQQDIQFSQKLATFYTGNDVTSNLNTDKKTEKQKYEEFIQKDVLTDQAKEFTYYYPKHNLSQIIQNFKTMKVSLCNAFAKYTLYNYKNYHIFPYKAQNTQTDQIKLYQSDQIIY